MHTHTHVHALTNTRILTHRHMYKNRHTRTVRLTFMHTSTRTPGDPRIPLTHIHTKTHTHTPRTHSHTHISTGLSLFVCGCGCMHPCVREQIFVCVCACARSGVCACVRSGMRACMHAYMRACVKWNRRKSWSYIISLHDFVTKQSLFLSLCQSVSWVGGRRGERGRVSLGICITTEQYEAPIQLHGGRLCHLRLVLLPLYTIDVEVFVVQYTNT